VGSLVASVNKKKTTVLYVDQAISFGGSVVVLGYLVNAIDADHFRYAVIGEMSRGIMEQYIQDTSRIFIIPRLYNYTHRARANSIINRIQNKYLRKVTGYIPDLIGALANSVYTIRMAIVMTREKVDIVHVNNGMTNLSPVIVSILLGRKCVVHYHGKENPGYMQRMLMNRVQKFIAVSDYIKDSLVEYGFPAGKIVVIPNPVQAKPVCLGEINCLRKKYGFQTVDRVFGIVGRIVGWKGHAEFLKAAVLVLEEVPDSKVLIVGDYSDGDISYQKRISELVESSGYKDRIVFTGYVSDVASHYSLMDVCAHTSIAPEPFGLVITEAMSYGVAVVASDRGAPKEIINHGEDGFIVNPDATEELADTIRQLLVDEVLRHRIGANGKVRVLRDYQVSDYGRAMENVYMEVRGNKL